MEKLNYLVIKGLTVSDLKIRQPVICSMPEKNETCQKVYAINWIFVAILKN